MVPFSFHFAVVSGERVLSWMPDVRVLAPKSLRDRIEEKLRDGLGRQRGIEEGSTSSSSGQAAEL